MVAPKHMRSSRTRDRTLVSCVGRWILILGATREVRDSVFKERIEKEDERWAMLRKLISA